MNCEDVCDLLDAYVDDELSVRDRASVESHVGSCGACAGEAARLRVLSRSVHALGRHPVPGGLSARLAAAVNGVAAQRHRPRWQLAWLSRASMPALLFSHVLAVLVGAVAMMAWLQAVPSEPSASDRREIVSAHVRGLIQDRFQTVTSGSPHTVRPWFAGKVGFAPRVVDLAGAGFPLQGGRVDHLLGRSAAALLYARRNHQITVFIESRAGNGPASASMGAGGGNGYHLIGWRDAEFAYWAVSDLNRAELTTFVDLLRAANDRATSRPPL